MAGMHADSGQRTTTASIRNDITSPHHGPMSAVGSGVVQGKAVVVLEEGGP